jgi:hypothetical protein
LVDAVRRLEQEYTRQHQTHLPPGLLVNSLALAVGRVMGTAMAVTKRCCTCNAPLAHEHFPLQPHPHRSGLVDLDLNTPLWELCGMASGLANSIERGKYAGIDFVSHCRLHGVCATPPRR